MIMFYLGLFMWILGFAFWLFGYRQTRRATESFKDSTLRYKKIQDYARRLDL